MKLTQLTKVLDQFDTGRITSDFEVAGISANSKNVGNNFVFVAVKGNSCDGNVFIKEAVNNGAKAIVTSDAPEQASNINGVLFIRAADTRKALADLAGEFYGHPSSKIKVAGITGTNGKTTVSYLIEALFKEADCAAGVIGTINYRFKNNQFPSKNTTPGPVELQAILAQMLRNKVGYVAMEVSSHGLDQERTAGIKFDSAIFTNLTQDHLDYHKTLEKYFLAKAKLFSGLEEGACAIINGDDLYGRKIQALSKARVISYGLGLKNDLTARDIKFDLSGSEFILKGLSQEISLKTKLIGRHNLYNILAAAAFGLKEGLDISLIKSAVEKFELVPGRLERIDSRRGFAVFIDYAHTDDALNNVITALRQISKARIILVFGCGGDRDKIKRPKMGKTACELADYAIITNDNPRCEDPESIINDIKAGIETNNYCVIPDRFLAIKRSLSLAAAGDIVLIAGKGHENYQVLKDKIIDFSDRQAVKECLELMKY